MSYLVLARKYRPQTFADLVGQDHVARTLANAIATGRIAHAFLFTGVRGVGKTTSARLLAKCLNCVGAGGATAGPTSSPCNACAPCREITQGQDLDVQEIDGASYNGVDEVRRLQEGMSFRPARDRFKIYVVDEVHMLSSAAWNAFLKTLEEPPPHVKFIFATTEVHKVPVTILSRCQRYDFKLIGAQTIARRLEEVLRAEGVDAEPAAIQVLAREAAGSMRDAMSLLDQVIAFAGTKLAAADVTSVLGVADRKILHELGTALVGGDGAACVDIVARLAQQGFDLPHVARDVLVHLRNLVVAKVCAAPAGAGGASLKDLLDLADEEIADVVALASQADADDLSRLFQGFSRAFDDVVRSGQPRASLEMALVRLARRPPLLPLDELLARVADLERRLGGAGPPAGPSPKGGGGRAPHAAGAGTIAAPAHGSPTRDRTLGALALAEPARPRADALARDTVAPSGAAAEPVRDLAAWQSIVERLRVDRAALASVFEHAIPIEVSSRRAVIGFEPTAGFLLTQASEPEALEALTRAVRAHFDAPTEVALEVSTRPAPGVRSVASLQADRRSAELARARAAVQDHPVVREIVRLFGAQVRDVKLPPGDG